MVTKKGASSNSEKLDSISFRGNKDKWIDFQYAIKKEGYKNIWLVLEPLVDDYLKKHQNGNGKK
jgi:hypothetical protein